eukprot:TRINITY_DN8117_c0_g1_i5.p1 TRINITY_DN8117_c0_g1~~TRINITY_DN8117_c0_g1_i5.p1  ORF type:complete len:212 (+),score=9.15 TRINITY_DN8117_c0_g1_i5:944-1579(+)
MVTRRPSTALGQGLSTASAHDSARWAPELNALADQFVVGPRFQQRLATVSAGTSARRLLHTLQDVGVTTASGLGKELRRQRASTAMRSISSKYAVRHAPLQFSHAAMWHLQTASPSKFCSPLSPAKTKPGPGDLRLNLHNNNAHTRGLHASRHNRAWSYPLDPHAESWTRRSIEGAAQMRFRGAEPRNKNILGYTFHVQSGTRFPATKALS